MAPKPVVGFVPRAPLGFAAYPNIPATLATNADLWRIPRGRLPTKADLDAYALMIEDGLEVLNDQAAGIVCLIGPLNGKLVWSPAATWRTSGRLGVRELGASVLALHGEVIQFPVSQGLLPCYPILACRTLALIFGAENAPDPPPQRQTGWCEDGTSRAFKPAKRRWTASKVELGRLRRRDGAAGQRSRWSPRPCSYNQAHEELVHLGVGRRTSRQRGPG